VTSPAPRPGTPPDPMTEKRLSAIVCSLVGDEETARLILGAALEHAAHVAEETCRPWPWPPPKPAAKWETP
jgi:hypothetical protein